MLALDQAIVSRWNSLTGLSAVPLFAGIAPEGTEYPFAVFQHLQNRVTDAFENGYLQEYTVSFKVYATDLAALHGYEAAIESGFDRHKFAFAEHIGTMRTGGVAATFSGDVDRNGRPVYVARVDLRFQLNRTR